MIKFLAGFIIAAVLVVGGAYWALGRWLPSAEEIKGCLITKMYEVNLCPGSKSYVSLKQISPYLQKTVVLTEDSSFFQHRGFDWQSIEKNAREGWETGIFKKGGSTISQQLAKNMFLSKDRTFIRKGREALITYRIEKTLSKKEILERYLNVIEFGKDLYGVKAAANFYFQKSPADLSILESAFLAMLLPNPKKYSTSFHKKELTEFAHKRIGQIIDNMYQYKRINDEEYLVATQELQNFLSPAPSYTTEEESAPLDEATPIEENEDSFF
ncbi:Penicillin-binding protein 1F [compost metagenome]